MLNVNMKQSVNVKFCVELGKSATETYDLLKKVYGDECLSCTEVYGDECLSCTEVYGDVCLSCTEVYGNECLSCTEVYGDECLSCTEVFKWFKRLKEGREEIEDDQRPGRPSTTKADANIERVCEIVLQNRRLIIRAVAELTDIDIETVRQILHNIFNRDKCVQIWCRDCSLLNKRKFE